MKRKAFTMIELVFVIVILGILASIAVPRLGASKTDAQIAKARADISAIRSSIATTRNAKLMSGSSTFPDLNASNSNTTLFGGVLDYPIQAGGASGWSMVSGSNALKYNLKIGTDVIEFTYDKTNGRFTCDETITACKTVTQ